MNQYRFGKHAPVKDYRTLNLKKYIKSDLPLPPVSFDSLQNLYVKLGINDPKILFPMDGNDRLGDCTIAALAHALTIYKGYIGSKQIMPETEVIKLYFKLTGGIDSGLDELNVLNYWKDNTVYGEKILGYVSIDPKNRIHIKQAIQLFGGVYLGFQVQEKCVEQFDAGLPWTPGPLTNDGHAVFLTAYDENGVTVLTWGNSQKGTWEWWEECVDEAYAILPSEADKYYPGLDLEQLKIDLQEVSN